jgi:hypothetical protein
MREIKDKADKSEEMVKKFPNQFLFKLNFKG